MANSGFSNFNPTILAREAERSLFVENSAMAVANTTLRNLVAGEGATVDRAIMSYPKAVTYTPGSDISTQALTGSKESLTIGTYLSSLVTIDDTERGQSAIDISALAARRMMKQLNNKIDQAVFSEVTNAQWSIDDGNVGGTSGNNAVITTGNIPQMFIAADTKLDAVDAPKQGRTAVVGGHFLGTLKLQQAGRPTTFGDGVNTRGVVTSLFGWDILYSNNLPYSAKLSIGTNPTDGDTVTIAGVTFTWKTTLGTTAGNIKICSDAAHSVTNLVTSINAPETSVASATDAGFVALSAENVFLLRDKRGVTATDNTTNITIAGFGDIVVSETLTAAADVWSLQRQDSLFCVKGCIDMVVQFPPRLEVTRDQDQFADIVKSLVGFGKKTYADGAREMVRVKLDASTADWS